MHVVENMRRSVCLTYLCLFQVSQTCAEVSIESIFVFAVQVLISTKCELVQHVEAQGHRLQARPLPRFAYTALYERNQDTLLIKN